ncbi:MAG: hypothetical protein IPH84_13705 [Bacteroidales bacterium]|nr:hypothetical protein [Bacteroidales bacterium]
MKKFTFFLAFSLFCFTASAQWVMQNPHPTDRHLRSVVFPDANTGYAVGTRGTIIKSSDGGNNWSVLTSGTTFGLNAVYFIDSNTGFAVGDGGTILKTINGGLSWLPLTACTGFKLNSVYFTDANVGYAVGEITLQGIQVLSSKLSMVV